VPEPEPDAKPTLHADDEARGAALVALVVLAFSPALTGRWLWDDDANVTGSSAVQRLGGIVDIWARPGLTQQYYPLTHSSFWLEWQLFGGRPLYFHALNLILHAGTVLVLWRILRLLMDRGAWLGAALFAVHPVQVESVAWITERKNVLAGLFASLAVWAYLRAMDAAPTASVAPSARADEAGWRKLLPLGFFTLGLAAKSAVAPLPFAMLALGELRRRRQGGAPGDRRALLRDAWRLLPLVAVALGAGLVTAHVESTTVGAEGAEFAWPPIRRVLVACHALWFYPQKLVAPLPLSFEYPVWDVSPFHAGPWLFVVATLLAASVVVLLRKRIPWAVQAALLGYVALIFPALSFFNVYFMRYAYAQDHFQYFACAPLLALVASLVMRLTGPRAPLVAAATILLVGASVGLAVRRSFVFRSNDALFGDAIAANPDGWHPYAVLAHDALERGDTASLVAYLEQVTRTRPTDPVFQDALGDALLQAGRPRDAIAPLRRAADATYDGSAEKRASAYFKLAGAIEAANDCQDARSSYETAHALAPGTRPIALRLALELVTCKPTDPPRAIEIATRACDVEEPRCLAVLATAYAANRDLDSAMDRIGRAAAIARKWGATREAQGYAAQLEAYRSAKAEAPSDAAR